MSVVTRMRSTHEQPRQSVLRRWREGDVTLALLECQHIEPATGKDRYGAIRCEQCIPVRKSTAPPLPQRDPFIH